MMNDLTEEQVRRIEAAVAECIGYQWKTGLPNLTMLVPSGDDRFYRWSITSGKDVRASDWDNYVPHFATDPAANAGVMDWLQEKGWFIKMNFYPGLNEYHYEVWTLKTPMQQGSCAFSNRYLSLCLAFLRAMGRNIEEILKESQHGQGE